MKRLGNSAACSESLSPPSQPARMLPAACTQCCCLTRGNILGTACRLNGGMRESTTEHPGLSQYMACPSVLSACPSVLTQHTPGLDLGRPRLQARPPPPHPPAVSAACRPVLCPIFAWPRTPPRVGRAWFSFVRMHRETLQPCAAARRIGHGQASACQPNEP